MVAPVIGVGRGAWWPPPGIFRYGPLRRTKSEVGLCAAVLVRRSRGTRKSIVVISPPPDEDVSGGFRMAAGTPTVSRCARVTRHDDVSRRRACRRATRGLPGLDAVVGGAGVAASGPLAGLTARDRKRWMSTRRSLAGTARCPRWRVGPGFVSRFPCDRQAFGPDDWPHTLQVRGRVLRRRTRCHRCRTAAAWLDPDSVIAASQTDTDRVAVIRRATTIRTPAARRPVERQSCCGRAGVVLIDPPHTAEPGNRSGDAGAVRLPVPGRDCRGLPERPPTRAGPTGSRCVAPALPVVGARRAVRRKLPGPDARGGAPDPR